jgi:tripartite ATP-independent transporter DctM subunit
MRRRGVSDDKMVSLLAASGAMTETIPPSLVLITVGSVTGVSMAALFAGGLLPALVLALVLGVVAWYYSDDDDVRYVRRATPKMIAAAGLLAAPALFLPFVIRFAVVEGIATATEVSTVGVAYTMVVGAIVYRDCEWRRLYPALIETASLSGCIMLIIGTATSMAWALTQSGFAHDLALTMAAMPGGAAGFMAVSILVFIVLGSLLEGIPAIVLLGPLLFPIAHEVGINEVQYAMVAILALGIGLFAPPFGVGYYYTCAIGRVSPDVAMYRIWPYLGAVLAGLIAVAVFPWISTCFL